MVRENCPYTEILSRASPTLAVLVVALRQREFSHLPGYDDRMDLWDLAALDERWFRERYTKMERIIVKLGIATDNAMSQGMEPAIAEALQGLREDRLLQVATVPGLTELVSLAWYLPRFFY